MQQRIKVILGFMYEDETGAHWDVTRFRDQLWENIGGEIEYDENGDKHHKKGELPFKWSDFETLDQSQLKALDYAVRNMGISEEDIKSWDDVTIAIDNANEAMSKTAEIEKSTKFTDLFKNETFTGQVEEYEKNLSTLSSAIQNFQTNGKLEPSEIADLMEQFDGIFTTEADITPTSIGAAMFDQLSKYIGDIRDHIGEDWTKEAVQQAELYISQLQQSYMDLGMTAEETRKKLQESVVTSDRDEYNQLQRAQYIENALTGVGANLDSEIVAHFIADPSNLEGTMIEIASRYKHFELDWEINVNTQQIENAIADLNNQRSNNESRISLNEARGLDKTRSDYVKDNDISNELIEQYKAQQAQYQTMLEKEGVKNSEQATRYWQNLYDEAQRNINAEYATQAQNNEPIRNLPIERIETRRSATARRISQIESNMSLAEAGGQTMFSESYEQINKLLSADNADLQAEIDALRQEAIDFEQGGDILAETYAQIAEKEQAIAENRSKMLQNATKIWEESLSEYDNKGAVLSDTTRGYQQILEDAKQYGTPTESMYSDYIDSLGDELENNDAKLERIRNRRRKKEESWIKRFGSLEAADNNGNYLANDSFYQGLITAEQNAADASRNYLETIREQNKELANLPIDRLEQQYNIIQKTAEEYDRIINKENRETTAGDYIGAMATNAALQENLRQRINMRRENLEARTAEGVADHIDKYSEEWWAEDEAINELESSLNSLIDTQESYNRSLMMMPIDHITTALDNYAAELSKIEAMNDLKTNVGINLTAEDYQQQIDNIEAQNVQRKWLNTFGRGLDAALGLAGMDENTGWRKELRETLDNNETSLLSNLATAFNLKKSQDELKITEYTQNLEELQNRAEEFQMVFDELERSGKEITADDYEDLMNNATGQIQFYEKIRDENLRLRDKNAESHPLIAAQYDQAYVQAQSSIASLKAQYDEWAEAVQNIPLTKLQNEMSDLQQESSEIQQDLTMDQTRGVKTLTKHYQKLMKNSKEQIKNLKAQNDELKKQQSELDKNGSKYREIGDQINSNNAAIAEIAQNQYEWDHEIALAPVNAMMESIQAAQAALSKGHLDDTTTLENLVNANENFASALATTTTGTYVDVQAMAELVRQEGDLTIATIDAQKAAELLTYDKNREDMIALGHAIDPTITSMEDLNRAISQHPDSPDFAEILNLQQANEDIQKNINNLQAQKEALLAMNSALGRYTMAQSTPNWSDPMQTIRNGREEAQKLYDQGWWGKDDLTSYAELIATNAEIAAGTIIDNFEKNMEETNPYLTEDASGALKWLDKMVEKGYAIRDASGEVHWDIDSMKEFADEMGRSTEFAEYMIMALKDAGYEVDISRIGDKYAESFNKVTGEEANAIQKMHNLYEEMKSGAEAGQDIGKSASAAADSLKRMKDAGQDPGELQKLVDMYNQLGLKNGFHIDEETFEFTPTIQGTPITGDYMDSVIEQMRLIQEGGNVNLFNRPMVDTDILNQMGYDAGKGVATVFTHTFSNEAGDLAANFTPILPNGDVMEPDSFEQYCSEVIEGVREDDLGLQIGNMFTGKYAIQNAADVAEKLHELQEQFYGMNTEIDFKARFDIDDASIEAAKNKLLSINDGDTLRTAWNNSEVSNMSLEDLVSIDHENGSWEEGEEALESLAVKLGIISDKSQATNEVIRAMIAALVELGVIDVEPEVNADGTEVNNVKADVEELREEASEPIEQEVIVHKKQLEEDFGTTGVLQTNTESSTITEPPHQDSNHRSVGLATLQQRVAVSYEAIEEANERPEEIVRKVKLVLEGGDVTPEQLAAMSEDQLANYDINVTGEEDLELVKQTADSLSTGFDLTVKIEEGQFNALISNEKEITVNTEQAHSALEDLQSDINNIRQNEPTPIDVDNADAVGKLEDTQHMVDQLGNSRPYIPITVDNGTANTNLTETQNKVDTLKNTGDIDISVDVNGNYNTAKTQLDNLKATIDQLQSKTITITTIKREYNSSSGSYESEGGGGATGTMLTVAHASGTAYNVMNTIPISRAFADGDVALNHDEKALVNEQGHESIVTNFCDYIQ